MNALFNNLALLQATETIAPAAGGNATMDFIGSIIPLVLIIGVFYFLIIRPQNKKQKEMQKMIESLDKGDKVVTIGGVHALVHQVKENSVILKVDDDCKMEFSKSAIATVLQKNGVEVAPAEQKK